jgi:hypothetical protein
MSSDDHRIPTGGDQQRSHRDPSRAGTRRPTEETKVLRPVEAGIPLSGVSEWLNGPPLSTSRLRGRVVLVSFWTYTCAPGTRSTVATAWS